MTPVTGDGVHQIAVGPIHAGVIESGHFRFHVIGERILAMDPRLFYKHRGLERAAEGRHRDAALPYVQRACAACAVANTLAYAHAVEDATGLQPDRELRVARTVLLELERVYNHLHDIGAICAGVGFAAGHDGLRRPQGSRSADQRSGIRASLPVRHHRSWPWCGASSTPPRATRCGPSCASCATDSRAAWRELEFAGSLQARLGGVGVLGSDDALRLGAVGPAARAAGIREDVRTLAPRLAYDGFTPAAPHTAAGDVEARLGLRAVELEASFDLLEGLLVAPLARGSVARIEDRASVGIGRVESARGATACAVELDGDTVTRVHLRTGSYANWPALAWATAGNLVPDFPLINKSFELCYACVDR